MYLRFKDGSIFETTDGGETFSQLTTEERLPGIDSTIQGIVAVNAFEHSGTPYCFLIGSPNEGDNQFIWRSTDKGVEYKRLDEAPKRITSFQVNPHDKSKILAVKYNTSISSHIYLSEDFGDTWKIIKEGNILYSKVAWSKSPKHPYRIYATSVYSLSGIVVSYWNYKVVYSDDLFETFETIEDRTADWLQTDKGIIGFKYAGQQSGPNFHLVHNSHEELYDFERSTFESDESVYLNNILDARETSILALTSYGETKSLFRSHHVKDPFVEVDKNITDVQIRTISNVVGNYFKNQFSFDLNRTVSYVSNTYGDNWQEIRPSEDLGSEYYVALDINSSASFISYNRANPGVTLMSGYITNKEILEDDVPDTLISNDAGLTWKKVWEPEALSQFISGGILVLAPSKESNIIQFSLDDGKTFKECRLSNLSYSMYLMSSPYSNKKILSIFSNHVEIVGVVGVTHNVMINIDFSNLTASTCEDEDYDDWSPHDIDHCANGNVVTYKRRNKECLNVDINLYEGTSIEQCKCKREDFKCEVPFQYFPKNDQCIYYDGMKYSEYLPSYKCTETSKSESDLVKKEGSLCKTSPDDIFKAEYVRYECTLIV